MARYAETADLADLGLPPTALANVTSGVQEAHLDAASALIDSYLLSKHALPLAGTTGPPNTYPATIVQATVAIAAFTIMTRRGYNPDEFDALIRVRYEDYVGRPGQRGWLDKLAAGEVHLAKTADATPQKHEGRARTASTAKRGW